MVRAHLLLAAVASLTVPLPARAQEASVPARAPVVDAAVESAVRGGTWSTGSARGRYRILVVMEGWEEVRHRAFLQWVQESASPNSPETIRASVDLTEIADMFSVGEPILVARGGRWYAAVRGTDRPMAQYSRRLTFALGPPSEVRLVAGK